MLQATNLNQIAYQFNLINNGWGSGVPMFFTNENLPECYIANTNWA